MKGFSARNLKYMRKFAEEYPDVEFVQQVAAQLPWLHIVVATDKIKDPQERLFYLQKAVEYGWSRSVMVIQIELGLYNRQGKAIINLKEKLPSPQVEKKQKKPSWWLIIYINSINWRFFILNV